MEACVSAQIAALQAATRAVLGRNVDQRDHQTRDFAEAACTALQGLLTSEVVERGTGVQTASFRRLQGGTSGSLEQSLDVSFLFICSIFVFLMQAGFAMLCAGSVRSKNTLNILIKNVIDGCTGAVAFYSVGYGLAYGTAEDGSGSPFFGSNDFFLTQTSKSATWHVWLFQWAFAAATATIVSGSVAERCTFEAYVGYSFYLSAFVYPTAAHWVWSSNGWLAMTNKDPLFGIGIVDFAGCAGVHFVGGLSGLIGAYFLGPRLGRFTADGTPMEGFEGHNATLVVLGTFLLWVGWYGFNPGSAGAISSSVATALVGRAAVTTTLAAGTAGITSLFDSRLRLGHYNLVAVCNGILSGLVAITASCACVEPWAAMIIGASGALLFARAESFILNRLRIDDPLSASAMHGCIGVLGALFVGVFAQEEYLAQQMENASGVADPYMHAGNTAKGLIYGGNGKLLLCQVIGVLAIGAWTLATMAPFFWLLRYFKRLRCSTEFELAGLDKSKHGGNAYNWQSYSGDRCDSASGQAQADQAQEQTLGIGTAATVTTHQVVTVGDSSKANAIVPLDDA